jgi:hypothetical protein
VVAGGSLYYTAMFLNAANDGATNDLLINLMGAGVCLFFFIMILAIKTRDSGGGSGE